MSEIGRQHEASLALIAGCALLLSEGDQTVPVEPRVDGFDAADVDDGGAVDPRDLARVQPRGDGGRVARSVFVCRAGAGVRHCGQPGRARLYARMTFPGLCWGLTGVNREQ